jgi:hypothetical protein
MRLREALAVARTVGSDAVVSVFHVDNLGGDVKVRHHDFYDYTPESDDPDAWAWVQDCCGGPWEERPHGHYAGCPVGNQPQEQR